jgi:uncharacterized protein YabE (DUF348 family)
MGIEPDADDRVAPPPSTPLQSGMSVRYDRIDVTEIRQLHEVPFRVHTEYTSTMTPGTSFLL